MARITKRRGVAAIEFAIVSPFLIALLAGVAEVGMGAYQAMQVQAAVEAGIVYTTKNLNATAASIALAVTRATGTPGIAATPAPLLFCGCPSATLGVVSNGCTTPCSGTIMPGHYVTVSAQLAHTAIVPFKVVPALLKAHATVRVQ